MLQENSRVPADNGTSRLNNLRGTLPAFMNESSTMGGDGKWCTSDDGLQLSCSTAPGIDPVIVIPVVCGAGVNSGDNATVTLNSLMTDILGKPRMMCATVDRGAYEDQSCPTTEGIATSIDAVVVGAAVSRESAGKTRTGVLANPFTSELGVQYGGSEKAIISVVNASGKVVASKGNVTAGMHRFDASNWNSGLYIVTIATAGKKAITLKAIRL